MLKRLWRWLASARPGSNRWWRQKMAETWNQLEQLDPGPPYMPWSDPRSDPMGDIRRAIDDAAKTYETKVVEYPPERRQETKDWVTEQLVRRTGGMTRHPFDRTQYPTPPTEADLAARDYVNSTLPSGPSMRAYFSKGYSMRYLNELLRRADQRDHSLSTEDLMALRARGLT